MKEICQLWRDKREEKRGEKDRNGERGVYLDSRSVCVCVCGKEDKLLTYYFFVALKVTRKSKQRKQIHWLLIYVCTILWDEAATTSNKPPLHTQRERERQRDREFL